MRVNNCRPGEFFSSIMSDRVGEIASWIIERGNRARLESCRSGVLKTSRFNDRYRQITDLALHKYPYRGPMPEWVNAGSLD